MTLLSHPQPHGDAVKCKLLPIIISNEKSFDLYSRLKTLADVEYLRCDTNWCPEEKCICHSVLSAPIVKTLGTSVTTVTGSDYTYATVDDQFGPCPYTCTDEAPKSSIFLYSKTESICSTTHFSPVFYLTETGPHPVMLSSHPTSSPSSFLSSSYSNCTSSTATVSCSDSPSLTSGSSSSSSCSSQSLSSSYSSSASLSASSDLAPTASSSLPPSAPGASITSLPSSTAAPSSTIVPSSTTTSWTIKYVPRQTPLITLVVADLHSL